MNTQHAMLMSLEDSRCASRVVVDSDLGIVVVGGCTVTLPPPFGSQGVVLGVLGGSGSRISYRTPKRMPFAVIETLS